MKCKTCNREFYYRESNWLFLFMFIVIIGAYLFEKWDILVFTSIINWSVAYIYNSERSIYKPSITLKEDKDLHTTKGEVSTK